MAKIRDGSVIKIHPETRDRLRDAKRGGESYDALINRLLDESFYLTRRDSILL